MPCRVEIDFNSGRENLSWLLTEAEAMRLQDRAMAFPAVASDVTSTDGQLGYLWRLESFVANEVNTVESGIRRAGGSPYELVNAFWPFLEEAKECLGPRLGRLAPALLRRMRTAFDQVLDATERAFVDANEPPCLGLANLAGVEDFLVGVDIALTSAIIIRPAGTPVGPHTRS